MRQKYIPIILIILGFIVIQSIPVEKPSQEGNLEHDLLQNNELEPEVKAILKTSCYDCHSNDVNYPWYSNVAPVSWLVARDINEGRKELNFSDWKNLSKLKKIKNLKKIAEVTESGEMPIKIYTVIHKDAVLNQDEIKTIKDWTEEYSLSLLKE